VIKKAKAHRRQISRCQGRLVSGTVNFTTPAGDRATLSRGHVVYAEGARVPLGGGRWQLLLADVRPLQRCPYMLTVHSGRHRRLHQEKIALG
jgi:hypothetical protein